MSFRTSRMFQADRVADRKPWTCYERGQIGLFLVVAVLVFSLLWPSFAVSWTRDQETNSRDQTGIIISPATTFVTEPLTADGFPDFVAALDGQLCKRARERGPNPQSLEVLAPDYIRAIPRNQYGDSPFGLVSLQQETVLYSFGRDGKDQTGTPDPAETDDIVVELPN